MSSATEPGVIPAKGDTEMPPANPAGNTGLPVTGASAAVVASAGAALLLGGTVLFVLFRRRRRVFAA